jgi:AraC family transcriptional activator of pobA
MAANKSLAQTTRIPQMKFEDFQIDLFESRDTTWTPKAPAKGSFHVFSRSETHINGHCKAEIAASRRDYYKISLVTAGTGIFTLGDQRFEVRPPMLLFIPPLEVKTWHATSEEQDGYYCIFTERLFEAHRNQQEELLQHPLFLSGGTPALPITEEQSIYLQSIFRQLQRENKEGDTYKQEAIIIYLKLLMLEAKRISAQIHGNHKPLSAAGLLAQRFTNKLEKQFPIETIHQQVALKTAKQFAQELNTHPNHLNASVKQITGRTVSEHIRQRILLEARLLLLHTNWQIAEIAWCLGFEDPGNFTHFFKNSGGQSPHLYRGQ